MCDLRGKALTAIMTSDDQLAEAFEAWLKSKLKTYFSRPTVRLDFELTPVEVDSVGATAWMLIVPAQDGTKALSVKITVAKTRTALPDSTVESSYRCQAMYLMRDQPLCVRLERQVGIRYDWRIIRIELERLLADLS